MYRKQLFLLLSFVIPCLVGCGNGLARVSGTVTVDGEVILGGEDVRATVYYNPVENTGRSAVGLVDAEGVYTLKTGSEIGVMPGDYIVTFTASKLIRSKDGGTPTGKRISPTRYAVPDTSDMRFTVEPGSNTIDLTMTSN